MPFVPRVPSTLEQDLKRFWSKVQKGDPNECWSWLYPTKTGYGRIRFRGQDAFAHRVSYEIHKGKIPKGFVVMHMCDNPKCVNPKHLSVGTQSENLLDMYAKGRQAIPHNALKTKCKHGHSLVDPKNVFRARSDSVTFRRCRECARRSCREAQARTKAAKLAKTLTP